MEEVEGDRQRIDSRPLQQDVVIVRIILPGRLQRANLLREFAGEKSRLRFSIWIDAGFD